MLIKIKKEGKAWKEINEAWETMTGKKFSGLPARYSRLMAALARVKDEDMAALQTAMRAIEEQIAEEKRALDKKKWSLVSAHMVEFAGTEKYDQATLEKAYKKIQSGETVFNAEAEAESKTDTEAKGDNEEEA
jgi:hypothetical protein